MPKNSFNVFSCKDGKCSMQTPSMDVAGFERAGFKRFVKRYARNEPALLIESVAALMYFSPISVFLVMTPPLRMASIIPA